MPCAARIIVGTVVTSSSSTTRGLVRETYALTLRAAPMRPGATRLSTATSIAPRVCSADGCGTPGKSTTRRGAAGRIRRVRLWHNRLGEHPTFRACYLYLEMLASRGPVGPGADDVHGAHYLNRCGFPTTTLTISTKGQFSRGSTAVGS